MQSPCALYAPHYTVLALRARSKRAVSRLTSRFRVANYCRRVDLGCDKKGIGGGGKHFDDNDAQPDASAAATTTATTTTNRKKKVCMQLSCAHDAPHYTVQALRAR